MTTKRERLDGLTAKLHANIDAAVDQLRDINIDIAATQADIDALTAVANRTAVQNVELRALRRDIALQRTCRTLVRNAVVTARFALFLDGGRARPSDLDGDDGDG